MSKVLCATREVSFYISAWLSERFQPIISCIHNACWISLESLISSQWFWLKPPSPLFLIVSTAQEHNKINTTSQSSISIESHKFLPALINSPYPYSGCLNSSTAHFYILCYSIQIPQNLSNTPSLCIHNCKQVLSNFRYVSNSLSK